MKKLAIALLLGSISSPLFAADLQCQIGPETEIGLCDTVIWGTYQAPASFSVVNVSKPVHQVIWSKPTACKNQGTYCSFTARSMMTYQGQALVLYTDGTYENLSATLRYEDGR
jgi:hypothetical protein